MMSVFLTYNLLVVPKSWANIRSLKAILLLFEMTSSLKVNFHISMLVGVNVSESWFIETSLVLNCKIGYVPFFYLGLPISGDSRNLNFWKPLIKIVNIRLYGWKSRNLSLGGRLVLLKYVMYSLPVYFLSFFKAPTGVITSLKFWKTIYLKYARHHLVANKRMEVWGWRGLGSLIYL